jgi:hypothetical protein
LVKNSFVGHFVQDSAVAHAANNSLSVITDLNLCDFNFSDILKDMVFMNNPQSIAELEAKLVIKFQLFPYGIFDMYLETYSHVMRHALK